MAVMDSGLIFYQAAVHTLTSVLLLQYAVLALTIVGYETECKDSVPTAQ
jgi:hypothetical protein